LQPSYNSEAGQLTQRAQQQFQRSQFREALATYQQALELYQRDDTSSENVGETLYHIAVIYRLLGDYRQAQTQINRALEIANRTGNELLLGQCFSEIGVIYYNLSDYPKAFEFYQEAIAISQDIGDRLLEGRTLDHMGVVYRRQGDYRQSLNLHQQALEISLNHITGQASLGFRALQTLALNNIGVVYVLLGEYPKSLEFNQQALDLSREIGNRFLEGRILSSLAVVYDNMGDYRQALAIYEQALTIHQTIGNRAEAGRTLSNIGGIYSRLGQYELALAIARQALALQREIGDRTGESVSLINIGAIYVSQGRYPEALDNYQQALGLSQAIGDRPNVAYGLDSIGNIYFRQGDYQQSLQMYSQALTLRREISDRVGEAYSLNSLGGAYYTLGQDAAALEYYQQALVLRREIGDRSGEATVLNNLGLVRSRQGQPQQALDFYQQSVNIRREIGDRPGEGGTLNNIGVAYDQLAQYSEALNALEQSLVIRREIGDRPGEATTLNNTGLVYEHLNQSSEALDVYQQALDIFQETGIREGERLALSNLGRAFVQQQQAELAIVFYKQAVNLTESIRRDLQGLSVVLQTSYTETVADTYRALADLLLQRDRVLEAQRVLDLLKVQELEDYLRDVRGNEQTEQGIEYLPGEQQLLELYRRAIAQGRELAQLEQIPLAQRTPVQQQRIGELRQIQREIVLSFDEFIKQPEVIELLSQLSYATRRQNIDLEQLNALQDNLRNLQQNAVLLYPLILEDRLELVLVTPYSPPIRRTVAVTREELNQAITQFRSLLSRRTRNPMTEAQQLYQWLIAPIEADLEQINAETIIYAPDGALRYIPLAALHDGNQWLIQQFQTNYITAASLTDFDTPPQSQLRVLAGAFTEGNVNVQIGTRQFRFAGLPFAGVEVENIAEFIPETTTLVNQSFTPQAMIPQMDDHTIVHLATHAEFVSGQPEESFIVFGNGDRITLRDISGWTLRNVDLIVLSACKTAVGGKLGNGEEILGFGYQMQRTGARAAIASLWAVDDGGTQVLMSAFYAALERGVTKAAALRQAQVALITGDYATLGIKDVPSQFAQYLDRPYYWAPFILIGNGL
jgi:CHAT domain-containing protein/Tfp pilus assembly protein PilF